VIRWLLFFELLTAVYGAVSLHDNVILLTIREETVERAGC